MPKYRVAVKQTKRTIVMLDIEAPSRKQALRDAPGQVSADMFRDKGSSSDYEAIFANEIDE